MDEKDRNEMSSPELVRHHTSETPSVPQKHGSQVSELGRFLPIFFMALIGALVVLRIVDGWIVIPLVCVEALLFFLTIRLWRPAARPH